MCLISFILLNIGSGHTSFIKMLVFCYALHLCGCVSLSSVARDLLARKYKEDVPELTDLSTAVET